MTLTDKQLQTLRAAMDTVIPADAFPGAWDAGAGEYLLRQLNGQLKHLLLEYQMGLDALDEEAVATYNSPFVALTADQQNALFTTLLEGEPLGYWPVSAPSFLNLLIHHTQEGFYADPGQGGNHNTVSWQMIGFTVTG